jgi:hypothetical protein
MTDTYSNSDLLKERKKAINDLTTRKLNTELTNIKMKVLGANNTSNMTAIYDYNYDPLNSYNDYFLQLIYKVQCMFYESSISYSIDSSSKINYIKPISEPIPSKSSSSISISYTIYISWV